MKRNLQTMRTGCGLIIASITLFFAACSLPADQGSTPTAQAPATSTIPAPATPTRGPGEVLFFSEVESPVSISGDLQNSLNDLAVSRDLVLRTSTSDLAGSLHPETQIVFVFGDPAGLGDVTLSHPEVTFVLLESVDAEPKANVFVIKSEETRNADSGFVSGYISALITPDYRVGGIALSDSGVEAAALQGFLNGVVFYCGLCRPVFPPFNSYPSSFTLSSTDPNALEAAVRSLSDQGVTTIYLSPGLSQQSELDGLSGSGIRFIGLRTPQDKSELAWVGSVAPDLVGAIQAAWDAWSGGASGIEIQPALKFVAYDETLLSPGKLKHIENFIDDLAIGLVDPGVDPQTGDPR